MRGKVTVSVIVAILASAIVDRFFRMPFVKKDRVAEMFKSLEKLRAQPQT